MLKIGQNHEPRAIVEVSCRDLRTLEEGPRFLMGTGPLPSDAWIDKERRQARAATYCRLCHRGFSRKKTAQSTEPAADVGIAACCQASGCHRIYLRWEWTMPASGSTAMGSAL